MGQKQTAFACVSCFYNACPHKDEPVIIKAKCSSTLTPDVEFVMTSSEHKQIDLLCKECADFVKYL